MSGIIQWCNSNQGFVSAILSVNSLILSFIAIVVSIIATRLPYKKRILLSSSLSYGVTYDNKMSFMGIEVAVTNIGNVPINVSYLGLGWFEKGKLVKMFPLNRKMTGSGILKPQERNTNLFSKDEIIDLINKTNNKRIYIISIDVNKKVYRKYYYKSNYLYDLIKNEY